MTKSLLRIYQLQYEEEQKQANKHWHNDGLRDYHLSRAEKILKEIKALEDAYSERSLKWTMC